MQRWVRSQPSDQIPSDLVKQLLVTQDTCNDQVPVNSFYPEAPKVDDHDHNSPVQIYASSQMQDHQAAGFSSISWHEQLNSARCGFEIGSGTLDDHQQKQEPLNLFMDSSSLISSSDFTSPTNLKTSSSYFPQGFFGEEDYSTNFTNTCPSSSDSSTGRLQHIVDDLPLRPYSHPSLSDHKATYKLQVSLNEDDDGFQGQTTASQDSVAVDTKKSSSHAGSKRSRSSTNLTTFKVRKEKLGDKINALQQLVSPFGKTDTASVLHDTIEYIKYLHDQVAVLSDPYKKHSHARFDGRAHDHVNRSVEASGEDYLKTRGLCLVPISATPDIAKDNPSEFWAATFGGNF